MALCCSLLGSCTVVKIEEEDAKGEDQYSTWTKTGTGFKAAEFVASVWEERIIPTYEEEAIEYTTLISALGDDPSAASDEYGLRRQTGEPFYVFKVRGNARVVEFDDSSRNGVIGVAMISPDDTQTEIEATLQVGPVIRGTAIRDSVEFIRFTDVGNQLQFAELASHLNARMLSDSVEPLDLSTLTGSCISFLGAFRLEEEAPLEEIVITPVRITPIECVDE